MQNDPDLRFLKVIARGGQTSAKFERVTFVLALQIALDVRRKNLVKIRRDGSQASCEHSNDHPAQRETSAAGIARSSSSIKSFTPVLQSRRKSLSFSKPSMNNAHPSSQRDESAFPFPKDDPTRRRIEYTPGSLDIKSTIHRTGRHDSEIQATNCRPNARTPSSGFHSTSSHDPYRPKEDDYDNEDFIYNDGEEGSGNFEEIDTISIHTTEAGMPMR